jgi:hypothetical protein
MKKEVGNSKMNTELSMLKEENAERDEQIRQM